jgi:molybdate transport system substrate-binding protein
MLNRMFRIRNFVWLFLQALVSALLAFNATAQVTPIRALVSNGMKAAMEQLRPQAERAIGRPLTLEFSSTAALKKKITAGEDFDVAMITVEAIDELIKQRKVDAGSRTAMGRSRLGIGVRAGAPKPDIHTPDALKRTLLAAKSITYPEDGASRPNIEQMFARMGIASPLQSRIILVQGSGPATQSVADGKAEMVITLFSEIVPVHGVEILGALPGEFQYDVRFEAAVSTTASNPQTASALIRFLAGPETAKVFKASGVDR